MLGAREVERHAAAAGFGDIAHELAGLAEPALLLRAGGGEPSVGRLGGRPRLPQGMAWPQTRWKGTTSEPLAFIAEFDLALLDPAVWPGPRSGTLSLFCHVNADALYVDSGGAALVLHHPPDVPLEPAEPPADLDAELRYDELPVEAVAATTLPWIGVTPARELARLGFSELADIERSERYLRMAATLAGEGDRVPRHRLLGWPQFSQEDVNGLWPGFHSEAVGHGLSHGEVGPHDWRLLLQVASDDRIGTCFGDGGELFFAIPAGDLAAGRFDRVQAVTDSG